MVKVLPASVLLIVLLSCTASGFSIWGGSKEEKHQHANLKARSEALQSDAEGSIRKEEHREADEEWARQVDSEVLPHHPHADFEELQKHLSVSDEEHAIGQEYENFCQFDADNDEHVTLEEWLARLEPQALDDRAQGKQRWHDEFRDADGNDDGKLTWQEWKRFLFHGNAQGGEFVDGHPVKHDPKEEEEGMLKVFREGDWDDSSDLSLAELESIMQDMAWRHNVHYDDEDDQLHRLSREVMEDLDQDKSGTLSEKEWLKYLKSETH